MVKIAKTVYSSELISLQDGTEVRLVPLAIGRLRRFMDAWGEFANISQDNDDNYAAFSIYVACSGVALERDLKEKKGFEKTFEVDEETGKTVPTAEYREYLEDVLDMETIFRIVEICGGINLNDPKLQELATANLVEDGTN